MKGYFGIAIAACLGCLVVHGCGDDCLSKVGTMCEEGVAYWVDSCGGIEGMKEQCECGCNAADTNCKSTCECIPDCDLKECGPDGCGGTCLPGCSDIEICSGYNICECRYQECFGECCSEVQVCYNDVCCSPDCENKDCGEDGCGSTCGSCNANSECFNDICFCRNKWSGPDCQECPGNWNPGQDCNACLFGWWGPDCEYAFGLWPVTPTGQEDCYNDSQQIPCPGTAGDPACAGTPYCGQDAQYADNPQSFDVQTVGGDSVVVDSLTGLVWQQSFEIDKLWQEGIDYCAGLDYAGAGDWRLPNCYELISIVDNGTYNPAIDQTMFPATDGPFWSSSALPVEVFISWCINFNTGYVANGCDRDHYLTVRCVRSDPFIPGPTNDRGRFEVAGSAGQLTVTDQSTGLVWQSMYITNKTWEEALSYCEDLSLGGYDDWRLPDIKELWSLVNVEYKAPATLFPNGFPLEDPLLPHHFFWSSTTAADDTSHAWVVYFYSGFSDSEPKDTVHSLHCVRSR